MPAAATTVLLVDPDPHARAMFAQQIAEIGCTVLEAADGPSALRMIGDREVTLVVTELYLETGDDKCLVQAMRRDTAHHGTRIVAHTHRSMAADRDWAMRAGADAYLIKPTRARRVRYVVSRLMTARRSAVAVSSEQPESPYRK